MQQSNNFGSDFFRYMEIFIYMNIQLVPKYREVFPHIFELVMETDLLVISQLVERPIFHPSLSIIHYRLNLNNKLTNNIYYKSQSHLPRPKKPKTMSASSATTDQSSQLLREQIQNQQSKKKNGFSSEQLGDKIILYVKSAFWLGLAIFTVYYSNFFHHLFWNPKINQVFFQIAMAGYTIITMLILYSSIVLPYIYKVKSIEEYNPKLIPVGAVVGVISVISLIIAIWPVWGFTSLLIFVALWKGFFSLPMFLPSGPVGDGLFLLINVGTVLSFYVIEHEGFLH